MFTVGNTETEGLGRYCSWLACGHCGQNVFVGEPVGTYVDSIECYAPLHITRLDAPALAPPPRIGLPIPAILAIGTALGFLGFLWGK